LFNDGVTRTAVVVLQTPRRKEGKSREQYVIGPGTFRFDANLGKTFTRFGIEEPPGSFRRAERSGTIPQPSERQQR
jgi:hypothetical protein